MLSAAGAWTCLCNLLQAVVEMHEVGWAHLDIKPSNLILERLPGTASLHPYLIDYGSCLQLGSGTHLKGSHEEPCFAKSKKSVTS